MRTSQELNKIATEKHGLGWLDAPVSGGVGGATAGTLTFMVGGTDSDFEVGKKVLEAMGKNIVHVGKAGSGLIAKLCNNLALANHMVGIPNPCIINIPII